MSRVFIVQEQKEKNFLPAEKFGEIQVLLTHRDIERGVEHIIDKLHSKLCGMTRGDHLVLVGDLLAASIAMHVALHFCEGEVSVLRWDREFYKYVPETVKI